MYMHVNNIDGKYVFVKRLQIIQWERHVPVMLIIE